MNIRKTRKRILSLLLALALCVSTWVGDFQTVMAAGEEITDQTLPMQTQKLVNESTDDDTDGDIDDDTDGDIDDDTDEDIEDDTNDDTDDDTDEDIDDGTNDDTDDDTDEDIDDGTDEDIDDDTDNNTDGDEEEITLTDEDIETISEAVCDALYDEIKERFYEEWEELCNSIAAEYGPDDEDNEEITDELYAQFYAELYESSCTLLADVLTEELDTAGKQEAYADLQNEAVYNKVYDSIYDKLYGEYVKGLKEMGITTLDSVAGDQDTSTEVIWSEEVGVTDIKVTGPGAELSEDISSSSFTIDLSKVAVLVSTDISVEMNFELLQGVGNPYDGGTAITERNIRGGDSYTITVPEGLIITALDGNRGNGIDLTTSDGMTVAKATLDGTTSITITFTDNINPDKENWDVKYGLKMTMQLDKDKLGTETTVDWEAINDLGGPDYAFTLPAAPASKPDSVTKSGKYDAAANKITWTIEIKGTVGVDIGGWTIVDTMDTSCQTYESASFTSGGTAQSVICRGDGGQNPAEYTYEIPEGSAIPATLEIVTTPTSETLAKLVDSGTTADIEINNNVYLKNADGEETELRDSDVVKLQHTTPIRKSGDVVSADLMKWTLTANPDKAYIYGAAVTDKLQSCLHLTGDDNGETKYIYIDGTKVTLTKDGSANKWKGSITGDSGSPIITCSYEEDPDGGDNILTIDFADGKGTLVGKSSEITFETSIDLDTGNRYTEESMKVTNIAEIQCRFPDYDGSLGKNTSGNDGGYGIGKIDWDVSQNMIEKSSSADKKEGNITWTIKPSIGTDTFKQAVITDEIDQGNNGNSKQTFVKDSIEIYLGNLDITKDPKYADYFEIGYDSTDNPTKLTITLYGTSESSTRFSSGDLNKMKITYQTHMDGLGTTAQDGTAIEQTYYNEAGLKVDNYEEVKDEESLSVEDDMLSKESTSYYEESENGSVKRGYKYTITINKMGMKINNSDNGVIPVVLKDELNNIQLKYNDSTEIPDTKAELELYKVVISQNGEQKYSNEVENSCRYYTYRVDSSETLGKLETTADFSKLAEDGSTVTVDLYVVITNADEFFKQGVKLQAVNKASVEVTTDTGNGIFEAVANGTTTVSTISNDLITKTASSKKAQSGKDGLYSDWKILINPWSADMGDITITDKIPQEQAGYVSFDYDSVKLYEAKHSATGDVSISETEATDYDIGIAEDKNGDIVLTVTIPECTKTYYLKYRTYYLSQKLGTSYRNSASLDGKGIFDDSSYEIVIDNSAWAEATKRASITVNKVDKDAVGTSAAICGATFALCNEKGVKILERATDKNGQIVFSGLALDKKYIVKETGPVPGYEWSSEVEAENRKEVETSAGNAAIGLTFFNTRNTGTVSFTKVDDSDPTKGLSGAQFLLYYTEGNVTKLVKTQSTGSNPDGSYEFVEFVNAAAGDDALITDTENAGTVLESAESGTKGSVKVTGLPWGEGTYYFVEAEGPNGYNADSSKHYEFTLKLSSADDKDDNEDTDETEEEQSSIALVYGNNFTRIDASGKIISDITSEISSDERYVILNSKYKFKLIKTDDSENPIAGVEFGLYSDEECKQLVHFAGNWNCTNSFKTDETGTVIIDDRAISLSSAGNPNYYYLKEISAPSDYKVSSDVVKFYIDSTTKKVVVVNKDAIKDYDITKAENENTFTLKDSVIQGSIALYKTDDEGKGIKGVKFDLYKLADAAVTKEAGSTSYSMSAELDTLIRDSYAKLIVNNLTTDKDGYWYSNTCMAAYTDFAGTERTVSEGLTGGWYCFLETEAVDNVIRSDEPYLFCIGEDAGGNVTITDAEEKSLLNSEININADGKYDISNSRIKAYLYKEGVDRAGNKSLLTDQKNQLTLTLYEKKNGKWSKVIDFKPGNEPVNDNSLTPYSEYSNNISQYLKTGKEYKIVETKPHSSLTYMKADDYYFRVDAQGDLYPMTLQEDGSFKDGNKLDPAVIVMQDVEATMAIQNHYTHEGIFVWSLTDSKGKQIAADQTLTVVNEGDSHKIIEGGIENGNSSTSLYMLQRGVKYTLTSTYYLTEEERQNNKNGYKTTTVVTCNDYGQLVLADGRELADNTFHIYGATQLVVKKVAADGVLKDCEIPGAKLVLLQDGKQAPEVAYNGDPVSWSWTTDGYKPVENGGTGSVGNTGPQIEDGDGKIYVYEDPNGNWNQRAGYVAGVSGATVFTLRETEAPSGYKRAADIKFSFDDSGEVEILSGAKDDQIKFDPDKGIVTITMIDEEGSDKTSGQSGPNENNNDVEAVVGTGYSANDSSSDTDTTSSAVQLTVAEADVNEQDKKEGRNVKTEDKTPIALYLILSVVTLGAFVMLTLLLKKKKSK